MINASNIFNLEDIIVNELVGDLWLTIILGLVLVLFVAIKVKMPMQVALMFSVLWLLIMFAGISTNLLVLWIFILLFAGVFAYYSVSRAFKRG